MSNLRRIGRREEPALKLLKETEGFSRPFDDFQRRSPSTPAPRHLYWTCPVCGEVAPYATPLGHWIRRSCACERAARAKERDAELFEAWKVQQAERCYGRWLGTKWSDSLVVRTLASKSFENFIKDNDQVAYDAARMFADACAKAKTSRNLIFYGEFGSGKTHLEAAILNYLRERRVTSLFVTAPMLFKALDDAMHHDLDHVSLLRQAIDCPVLVIDDIDKASHTPAREDNYFFLLDERYKAKRPTVISTNKWDTLGTYIGAAAFSRITAKCRAIEMVGGNYRVEEALADDDEEF